LIVTWRPWHGEGGGLTVEESPTLADPPCGTTTCQLTPAPLSTKFVHWKQILGSSRAV
jgi:hypothetical protein